jgi:Flp pilus assembly CpaE family ATPase
MRDQAPQVRLWLVESGATGARALIGKSEFEKGVAKALDASLSHDPKAAGAAANSGQPLPLAVPKSPVVREFRKLAEMFAGPAQPVAKRKMFALPW